MFRITSGPWKAFRVESGLYVGPSSEVRVCKIIEQGFPTISNADLIAQAPELLFALEALVRAVEQGRTPVEVLKHAKEAVRNAHGEFDWEVN